MRYANLDELIFVASEHLVEFTTLGNGFGLSRCGAIDELFVVDDCEFIHFVKENFDGDWGDVDHDDLVDDENGEVDVDQEFKDQTIEVRVINELF